MNKITTYIACFWLFVVLDSFFIWNRFENVITLLAYLGVIGITCRLQIRHEIHINAKAFIVILCVALCFLWMLFSYSGNAVGFLIHIIRLISILTVFTWPIAEYEKLYNVFRRIILFFAIGSTIVSVLTATGLIKFIPYYELPPRSPLHESLGIVYYVYGFFVTNQGSLEIFPRACGMLQEPGHFAIILGFVYMADRLLGRKLSLWVIVCGFLTFSSNFPLIIVITEIYNLLKFKNLFNVLKWFVIAIFVGIVLFNCLSRDLQDTIKYLAYERNLEEVIDAMSTSGSLTDALDKRTSSSGDTAFRNINSSNMWVGLGHDDTLITLSDYRGVILQYGVIGLALIVFAILAVTMKLHVRQRSQIIAYLLLVLIQRSWMFYAPYLYFLTYVLSNMYMHKYRYLQDNCER